MERAEDEPGAGQQHVDAAHDGVEGEERPVRDGEVGGGRGGEQVQVHRGRVVLGVDTRPHVHHQQVHAICTRALCNW